MSQTAFRIPRHKDRELLTRLTKFAAESPFPNTTLHVNVFPNAQPLVIDPKSDWKSLPGIKDLITFDAVTIHAARVSSPFNGTTLAVAFERQPTSVIDEVKMNWPNSAGPEKDVLVARFAALAQKALGAIHFLEPTPNLADQQVSAAHAAVLEKLESAAARSIELTQAQLVRNDAALEARKTELAEELNAKQEQLRVAHEEQLAILEEKREALKAREKLIDQRDNTHVRRDLLAKMLERVTRQEEKLQLSADTQRKRLPIRLALAVMASGLIYAFAQTFGQLSSALATGNNWVIGGLVATKAVIVGLLLGVAWWYVQWEDRWFREHADNEFRLKQLHLDFTRASWLVETALEWETQNVQMPAALFDRLSTGLFTQRGDSEPAPAPPGLASLLLANATSMEANVPGAKLALDRAATRRVQATLKKGEPA